MKKLFIYLTLIIVSMQLHGNQPDSNSLYKKLIKPNYTDLDSNYRDIIENSQWKLIASYERCFLFFRKFELYNYHYKVNFNDSTVKVEYGDNSNNVDSYTVDFVFDKISPDYIVFKLYLGEAFAYQLLRFEDGYMIVNYIYINRQGKLKKSKKRLLFKLV